MTALVFAAAMSLAAIDERCKQQGDIFACEAVQSYEARERVSTPQGCVEREWIVTEVKTSKRAWGDDDPFIENTKTTRKLKASRVVSKSCGR